MFEHDITEYVKDGRLCEPNDGIRYHMREKEELQCNSSVTKRSGLEGL